MGKTKEEAPKTYYLRAVSFMDTGSPQGLKA
jgi:hypothetical protein